VEAALAEIRPICSRAGILQALAQPGLSSRPSGLAVDPTSARQAFTVLRRRVDCSWPPGETSSGRALRRLRLGLAAWCTGVAPRPGRMSRRQVWLTRGRPGRYLPRFALLSVPPSAAPSCGAFLRIASSVTAPLWFMLSR